MKFRNNLVSLLDSTINRTSSLLGAMSQALDEMDAETQLARLDSAKNSLIERGGKMFSGIGGLLRQVRENANLFVVRVPYNEAKEEITHTITDNVLSVTKRSATKNSQSESVTTATIPDDCDIARLKISYNEKKHIIAYIFPKIRVEDEN